MENKSWYEQLDDLQKHLDILDYLIDIMPDADKDAEEKDKLSENKDVRNSKGVRMNTKDKRFKELLKEVTKLEITQTKAKMEYDRELIETTPDDQPFIKFMTTKLALMGEYLIALNKFLEEQDGN
jgi:hypothetical protein